MTSVGVRSARCVFKNWCLHFQKICRQKPTDIGETQQTNELRGVAEMFNVLGILLQELLLRYRIVLRKHAAIGFQQLAKFVA